MLLRSLLLLGTLATGWTAPGQTVAATHAPAGSSRTYVAKSLNRHALPSEVRVASNTSGYYHWLRLEQAVLRLEPNGRFTASFRYYHEHLKDSERPAPSPVLGESQHGTFSIKGSSITFVSHAPRNGKLPKPVTGTIRGDEIEVHYLVRDGQRWRDMMVLLERDPSYW